jgi:hypothetical protein
MTLHIPVHCKHSIWIPHINSSPLSASSMSSGSLVSSRYRSILTNFFQSSLSGSETLVHRNWIVGCRSGLALLHKKVPRNSCADFFPNLLALLSTRNGLLLVLRDSSPFLGGPCVGRHPTFSPCRLSSRALFSWEC